KDALLKACVAEAVRPDDTGRHLEAISLDQPLADRLTEAAEAIRGYLTRMGAVISALAAAGRLEPPKPDAAGRPPDPEPPLAALPVVSGRDQGGRRRPADRLADAFHLVVMSAGRTGAPDPLTAEELVDLFLHGAVSSGEDAR